MQQRHILDAGNRMGLQRTVERRRLPSPQLICGRTDRLSISACGYVTPDLGQHQQGQRVLRYPDVPVCQRAVTSRTRSCTITATRRSQHGNSRRDARTEIISGTIGFMNKRICLLAALQLRPGCMVCIMLTAIAMASLVSSLGGKLQLRFGCTSTTNRFSSSVKSGLPSNDRPSQAPDHAMKRRCTRNPQQHATQRARTCRVAAASGPAACACTCQSIQRTDRCARKQAWGPERALQATGRRFSR